MIAPKTITPHTMAHSTEAAVQEVVDLFKAERVDVEVEGFVLVADANTDGAGFREHRDLLCSDHFMFNKS